MKKNTPFALSKIIPAIIICLVIFLGCAGENAEKPNKDSNNTKNEPAEPKDDPSEGSADEPVGFIEDEIDTAVFYVILTNETSINTERQFTPEDFPEVCLESVEDYLPARVERIERLLENRRTGDWSGFGSINYWLEYLDNYGRTLKLTLTEKSRENILEAIDLLGQREDVWYAIPEYLPWPQLDAETEKRFIRDFAPYVNLPESVFERMNFYHYYGMFNGCVVYADWPGGQDAAMAIYFDEYAFGYSAANTINVWQQGENSKPGCFFIIGRYGNYEYEWRHILSLDHVRSMHQRYLYYRYELGR